MGLIVDIGIPPCRDVIVPGQCAECAACVGAAETEESVALGKATKRERCDSRRG
jgi:hypothetical protein